MKQVVAILAFLALTSARPKAFIVSPDELEPLLNPAHRIVRSAQEEDANRRQYDVRPQGAFSEIISNAGLPRVGDGVQLRGPESRGPPLSEGSDHVDYGSYTNKKGAFGSYSDHPVALKGH